MSTASTVNTDQSSRRVNMFGIALDSVDMAGAVNILLRQLQCVERTGHMVVTPNTDHIVMLQSRPDFLNAYHDALLVVADGKPVVWASHLLGKPLPSTVPGSDLVPALFSALPSGERKVRVFLFGAGPGVALRAQSVIQAHWGDSVEIVGAVSPEFGFERDDSASAEYVRQIAAANADVVLVGLGAPKQELWSHMHRNQLNAKLIMCIGATIDFLAGEKKRSPKWMQTIGFEWFYRMCQEPRRLVKRYVTDAVVFPVLLIKEFVRHTR